MREDLSDLGGEFGCFLRGEGESGEGGDIGNVDLGCRHEPGSVEKKPTVRKKERGILQMTGTEFVTLR